MIIRFNKNFAKKYKKLSPKLKDKVDKAIFKFQENPQDPTLKNHKLSGQLLGKRAFSVTSDMRIIYKQSKTNIEILTVGTHNQVY